MQFDCRLPIGLGENPIENRQLKIGNAIGRYRFYEAGVVVTRTVPICNWQSPIGNLPRRVSLSQKGREASR